MSEPDLAVFRNTGQWRDHAECVVRRQANIVIMVDRLDMCYSVYNHFYQILMNCFRFVLLVGHSSVGQYNLVTTPRIIVSRRESARSH